MNSLLLRWMPVLALAASLFASTTYAAEEPADQEATSATPLAESCRAAKAAFDPLTKADLAEVKAELLEAVARLDSWLAASGQNGANWREYLQWDQMQAQLQAKGDPDLDVLDKVYKQFNAGHEGLKLVRLADVRRGLQLYRDTARNIDNPKLQPAYEQLLDALADHIETFAAKPSNEEAVIIGTAVGQLEDARQVPELVAAVRQQFVRPNLLAEVSAETVSAAIGGPVDEVAPVRDCIMKADIYGTGHTVGQTAAELVPDTGRGVIDVVFQGVTKSNTAGYRGPLIFRNSGITQLSARKRFWVDDTGLDSSPAVSRASTKTTLTGVQSRSGRAIVERFGWKAATSRKCESEAIASGHAEQRANRRIDQEAADMLDRANDAFVNKFRRPLLNRGLFPQQLGFSTTEAGLHVRSLQAGPDQLAAPTEPPALVEKPDVALRVHESMLNNLASMALAGMKVRDETVQQTLIDLLGELPERFKAEEDQEPWAVDFARQRPISVTFADGQFSVTIRGRRYYRAGEAHPGMDVTAVYKISATEQGFKAVRQGELQIFPPGFVPGGDQKLSSRQIVIRKLLERRFNGMFKEEIIGEGFELPGQWKKIGKLQPVQLTAQDGWLTVAWRRVPAAESVAGVDR